MGSSVFDWAKQIGGMLGIGQEATREANFQAADAAIKTGAHEICDLVHDCRRRGTTVRDGDTRIALARKELQAASEALAAFDLAEQAAANFPSDKVPANVQSALDLARTGVAQHLRNVGRYLAGKVPWVPSGITSQPAAPPLDPSA